MRVASASDRAKHSPLLSRQGMPRVERLHWELVRKAAAKRLGSS